MQSWDADRVRSTFALTDACHLLKSTISLCPDCLAHVPAAVFERSGKVYIASRCGAHGTSEALVENDAGYYRLTSKDRWGVRYSGDAVVDLPAFRGCCGEDKETPRMPDADFWPHGSVAREFGAFNEKAGIANRMSFVLDSDGIVCSIINSGSLGTARESAAYIDALGAIE